MFTAIYGSPPGKAALLRQIVQDAGVAPDEALMVGDAGTDRDAAAVVGTLFYGIGPDLKGGPYPWSQDLTALNDWIERHADQAGRS